MSDLSMDALLAVDKYDVDEDFAHIELSADAQSNLDEYLKLVRACPAGLYRIDDASNVSFDHAGCLECGTCRILCGTTILSRWEFPRGSMGIEYRFG